MAYQTIYRLSFKNDEGQDMIIHISDVDSGTGTPTYHDLTIASCQLEVANGGDDAFSIVRASTLSLSFVPTQTYGLNTFKSGIDRKFLVEVFAANTSINIFRGWLLTDETKESLLPKSVNGEWAMFTVELTAICGLSTLKELPLLDADTGLNPRGWFRVIEYLSWALKATGHELPINMVDSIVYAIDPVDDGNWVNTTAFESKSAEADVNVSISNYEVLEAILKGRFITQYLGEWWIVRIDEMIGGVWNIFKYNADGVYLGLDTNTYEKTIGKTQDIKFTNKDAFVFPARPHKYNQLEYRYELPKEIIDNYNLERGAQISFTPGPPHIGKYQIDDWTLVRVPNLSATATAYIRREFADTNQTYELNRCIAIEPNANWHYLRSNEIFIMTKDKVVFSFDRKLSSNHSAGGTTTELMGQLRLVGDDGTFWTCNGNPGVGQVGEWVACNSTFTTNQRYMVLQYQSALFDERDWQTVSLESWAAPVGGKLYCLIYASSLYATSDTTFLSNLNFDYIPYILGDYSKFSAQYHKVSQSGEYKANLEEGVKVSDSPKRLFKWALHFETDTPGEFALTGLFFWDYRLTPTGGQGLEKFGRYQAYDYFNQNFEFVNKIQGSMVGMNSLTNPSNMPGPIHQYEIDFATNDDHTENRTFQMISFKQDLITCKWEGVLVPTNISTIGHPATWDHEFKYKPQ